MTPEQDKGYKPDKDTDDSAAREDNDPRNSEGSRRDSATPQRRPAAAPADPLRRRTGHLQNSWLRRTAARMDRNREQDVYGTIFTGMIYCFPPAEGTATPITAGLTFQFQCRTAE